MLKLNFKANLLDNIIYINNDSGYYLTSSNSIQLKFDNNIIYTSQFTGVIRLAYFNNKSTLTVLENNDNIYPLESTISVNNQKDNNIIHIDTIFTWTTDTLNSKGNNNLLMYSLPHHNIANIKTQYETITHPIMGQCSLVTTNNSWILQDELNELVNKDLSYPKISSPKYQLFWRKEMTTISNMSPQNTVDWCKWLGSIANMILIGEALNNNIDQELQLLKNNLDKLKSGYISDKINFIYDTTWNGVIGNLGLNNTTTTNDNGNAYYYSHIGQYGYLMFAMAVVDHYDPTFLDINSALYFIRDTVNPFQKDPYFPLWRDKDWYYGYSLNRGLSSNDQQTAGENVLGYYSAYLLSLSLGQQELSDWTAALLASEITALQQYAKTDHSALLIKPLTNISSQYIIKDWLNNNLKNNNLEDQAYNLALLNNKNRALNEIDKINEINKIDNNNLPYGSSWSSIIYWLLSR